MRMLLLMFLLPLQVMAAPRSRVFQQGDYLVKQFVVPDFDKLPLDRKLYVYYLAQASEAGRDIVWTQLSKEGLAIRNLLESLYGHVALFSPLERAALEEYLFKINKAHGLYDISKNEKHVMGIALSYDRLLAIAQTIDARQQSSYAEEVARLHSAVFDKTDKPVYKVTNSMLAEGQDLIADSGSNFYGDGVTHSKMQELPVTERHHFLSRPEVNEQGQITLRLQRIGDAYGTQLAMVDAYLAKASQYANEKEKEIIAAERTVLRTGDPNDLQKAEVLWTQYKSPDVDFRIGFIEVYDDPMGVRGYWQAHIVLAKQDAATKARHATVRGNAAVFESLMPVNDKYKKPAGFTPPDAESVYFVFAGGEVGEAPPLGINLPNDPWIRENFGSKSITAENTVTDLGGSKKDGLQQAKPYFHEQTHDLLSRVDRQLAANIHVEFHEILGHGSGRNAEGVTEGLFGPMYSPLEEARAEVAAVYHMLDFLRLRDLGIYPSVLSDDAARDLAEYSVLSFFTNQLRSYSRLSDTTTEITQAHQHARQVMLNWLVAKGAISVIESSQGIPQIVIHDLMRVRESIGELWAVIQEIKSEGQVDKAKQLFAKWGTYSELNKKWRGAVLAEMARQGAPKEIIYLNPTIELIKNNGVVTDVQLRYSNGSKGLRGVVERQIEVSARNRQRTAMIDCGKALAAK